MNTLRYLCIMVLSLWSVQVCLTQETNIMTYNIKYNTETDGINKWDNRKDKVASILRFYEIDICGMQEALIGQIDDLRERLPEYAYIGVGRDDGAKGGEFSPIFYNTKKFKLLEQHTFWLSETPDQPSKGWDASYPRIVTYGHFQDLRTNKKFYVFNTHLDYMGKVSRVHSSKLIVEKIKTIPQQEDILLIGDFNTNPEEEPIQILETLFTNAETVSKTPHFGPEDSFTGFEAKEMEHHKVDYIFFNKNRKGISVRKHATLSNTWGGLFASDHHPVMAVVGLTK